MKRDYSMIEKVISETGFFSEYLPPCFKIDKNTFLHPPKENCDLIAPVCFTMSRYNKNDARRNIFIPEVGSYIVTQIYIKQEHIIQELIEFSETSAVSFSPILGEDNNIVRHEQSYIGTQTELEEISSEYTDNIARKIISSAGAKSILKLDISNCFSSFYMHMIPAILLGMEGAESEFNKFHKNKNDITINPIYLKYSKLDSLIRHQNLNRTNGLLTGTVHSKIIAEGILSRIDKELETQGLKFSRYVDDYEVYIYEIEEKQIISIFEKTLKRYGFVLNSEKTELVEFPYYVAENLVRLFRDHLKESLDNSEIMALFNSFLTLERDGIKGSIRYLLKSIEKCPIDTTNPDLYKAYLLTILRNNERSLTKVCSLLIDNKDTIRLDPSDVESIIILLNSHLSCEHDLEVIWLLYLLIRTQNINKTHPFVSQISNSNNELAKIMLLQKDLLSKELLSNINANAVSWILLYELYAVDHISESDFVDRLNVDKNLDMYQWLKREHIHFCEF